MQAASRFAARLDWSDRRLRIAAGVFVLACVMLGLSSAIAHADVHRELLIVGLLAALPLVLLALRRPYAFPYALYVVLVPFDNLLKIGSGGTLTKLLAMLSVAALLAYAVRKRRLARPPLAVFAWLAFWILTVLGTAWTTDVDTGRGVAVTFGSLVLVLAVLGSAPITERELRGLTVCVIVGGVAAAIYGIMLFHGMSPAEADPTGRLKIDVDNRAIDANHFANALLAPIALALVALFHARKPLPIIASLTALAVLGSAIVISLSREAMLACVLMILVLIVFSRRKLLAALSAIPLLVGLPLAVPAIGARMQEALTEHGGGRNYIWHVELLAWHQHPLFGWGTGAAVDAYNANYLRVWEPVIEYWSRPPHNTWLHILVELGIVGLTVYVGAWICTFAALRGIGRDHPLYDLRVALTAALVGLAFVTTFIDLADYKYVWLVFFLAVQFHTVAAAQRRASMSAARR